MYPQPYKIKKIQLRDTENMGKGFFALEDIAKSQQILIVTNQTFITCDRYSEYYEFHDLKNREDISNKVLFSYFLATIKVTTNTEAEIADIYEYFKILPPVLNTLLRWSTQELKMLENEELSEIIKSKKASIKKDFEIIKNTVKSIWETPKTIHEYRIFSRKQEIENVTLDLVEYFYSIVESRSVYYQCQEDTNSVVGALVPILQLFNHNPNPQCEVMGNHRFIVTTTKPIRKGEEVFVSYGKNTEEKFLELYGFLQTLKTPIPMDQNYRKRLAQQYNNMFRVKKQAVQAINNSETQS